MMLSETQTEKGRTASSGHPEIPLLLDCELYMTSHGSRAQSIEKNAALQILFWAGVAALPTKTEVSS